MMRSAIHFLFLVGLFLGAGSVDAQASAGEYDHFVGEYAYEGTPYWLEFEIIKEEDTLRLRIPASDFQIDLSAHDGVLTAKNEEGETYTITFEPAKNHYIVAGVTQVSTDTSIRPIPDERILVKLRPSPNEKLEKEYGVRAADLVRAVRESEAWIHQVKSIQIKARDTWVRTEKGIEHNLRELQEQFPGADISAKRFSELRPEITGRLEASFDDARFYFRRYENEINETLGIWDGKEYIEHYKAYTHDQDNYAFRKDTPDYNDIWVDFTWPRSMFHDFWWQKNDDIKDNWEDYCGQAEAFILVGKQDYRGVSCYVLECFPKINRSVRRWLVGVEDGLLYTNLGVDEGVISQEQWTMDYRQVRSGWWMPMTQGYHIIRRDENRKSFIVSTREITVDDVNVDEVLPEALFTMDIPEGARVSDDRFGGLVVYAYKKDRSAEEWEQIRLQAQQRAQRDTADMRALDELVGKEACEFPQGCKWINTEPLTMAKLRGKAVIVQFWGVWCGPCHGYMNLLSAKSEDEKIIVIGIHTPESDLEKIKADMEKYKADGPVCVDVGEGWGELAAWYHNKLRPYWVAIGPDGKVVGHAGDPGAIFALARQSLETEEKFNASRKIIESLAETIRSKKYDSSGKGTAILHVSQRGKSETRVIDFMFKDRLTRSDYYVLDEKKNKKFVCTWAVNRSGALANNDYLLTLMSKPYAQFDTQLGYDFHPKTFDILCGFIMPPADLLEIFLKGDKVKASVDNQGLLHASTFFEDVDGGFDVTYDTTKEYKVVSWKVDKITGVKNPRRLRGHFEAQWEPYGDNAWYIKKAHYERDDQIIDIEITNFEHNPDIPDSAFTAEGLDIPVGKDVYDQVRGINYRYGQDEMIEIDIKEDKN